jgi:Arc/MetJ-type ribon-helix-helix transcriptional regulator
VNNVDKSERIALRLEPELRRKAKQLIEDKKFKNLSEIVREALKQFLSKNA